MNLPPFITFNFNFKTWGFWFLLAKSDYYGHIHLILYYILEYTVGTARGGHGKWVTCYNCIDVLA